MSDNPLFAAESFRQVLSHGPYEKIDKLIEIIGRESSPLCNCLIQDAQLLSPGLLELPSFFRSPETVYSHYSFWKIVSLISDKPLWYYNFESFGFSDFNGAEAFRLPPGLIDAPSLKTLILKNLNIEEIPMEVWSMKKLRILDISGNRISYLDKGIGRLRQLVYFNASDNELEILPNQLGGLTKLQILNLSGNSLQNLGFSLDRLVNLKKLNLTGNCLGTLPLGLNALFQLERVQLAYNDLSAEEEAVWEEGDFSQIPSYQWHLPFEKSGVLS